MQRSCKNILHKIVHSKLHNFVKPVRADMPRTSGHTLHTILRERGRRRSAQSGIRDNDTLEHWWWGIDGELPLPRGGAGHWRKLRLSARLANSSHERNTTGHASLPSPGTRLRLINPAGAFWTKYSINSSRFLTGTVTSTSSRHSSAPFPPRPPPGFLRFLVFFLRLLLFFLRSSMQS